MSENDTAVTRSYLKIAALIVLVLSLLIPLTIIDVLTGERARLRQKAVAEIGAAWGHPQRLLGPVLVVPYRVPDSKKPSYLVVLPETLSAAVRLAPEERYRGIHRTTVYKAAIGLAGRFKLPDLSVHGISAESLDWSRAIVSIGLTDPRNLTVDRSTLGGHAFEFAAGSRVSRLKGIHAPLGRPAADLGAAGTLAFDIRLRTTGRERIFVAPVGRETTVTMTSSWRHPSFGGAYLPATRKVGARGFEASWTISHLGRNFPGSWVAAGNEGRVYRSNNSTFGSIRVAQFGVDLISPVDFYSKIERATKYGMLLVLLVVAAIFIFEVVGRVTFHPIEYGLVGLALVLFYLLLLSFGELMGFALAYLLAAAMSVGAIAAYAGTVFGSWRKGAVLGAMVAIAYGYGFVLLQLQDYALVSGAVGLFAILATIMFVTRNVDWATLARRPARRKRGAMLQSGSR